MEPWSRGREVAHDVLRSYPKPERRPIFRHRRAIENFCCLFSTQQRPNVFVSDAWPAPATYHRSFCEHCDQRVVGAPNERAPLRFHGAVVVFVDRYLSRTRNPAASSKHLAEFFSGRSWPKISPRFFFFGVFEKFETFSFKICAHGERYRNRLAGIYEIPTFLEASRFHCHRNTEVPTSYVHSVTIELAKLILVGTWTTYQATVDAYHF